MGVVFSKHDFLITELLNNFRRCKIIYWIQTWNQILKQMSRLWDLRNLSCIGQENGSCECLWWTKWLTISQRWTKWLIQKIRAISSGRNGTHIFQEETSLTSCDRKVTDENSNKGKRMPNISRISFAFSFLISLTFTKIIITIGFFATITIFLEVSMQIIVLSYKYTSIYLTEPRCGLSIFEC